MEQSEPKPGDSRYECIVLGKNLRRWIPYPISASPLVVDQQTGFSVLNGLQFLLAHIQAQLDVPHDTPLEHLLNTVETIEFADENELRISGIGSRVPPTKR